MRQQRVVCTPEQGVPFQLVHIDLAARPQWFTSLSGLVPLVEYPEGNFHRESLDICRYHSRIICFTSGVLARMTTSCGLCAAQDRCPGTCIRMTGAGG